MSPPAPLVLIVDDDERNRKLAADLLRLAGYRIVEAAGGREAVALAAQTLPQVVLMDLRLPDMDGAQAARLLHASPITGAVPIIALTATSLEGEEDWLAATGFSGYIRKPIDIDRFATLIGDFVPSVGA